MKKILFVSCVLLMTVSLYAEKLPKGVYLWSDFESAKEEAVSKKKPLMIVFHKLNSK